MSGDPTRGITCPDMRRVVREALHKGWVWSGMTGTTHAKITWTDGRYVTFGTTPSSGGSWKTTARDIENISGVEVWRRGNHKRSRKKVKPSGFRLGGDCYEDRRWHQDVESLLATRDRLIAECRELAGDRATLHQIPKRLAAIGRVEDQLHHLCHPVEAFDPYTLR